MLLKIAWVTELLDTRSTASPAFLRAARARSPTSFLTRSNDASERLTAPLSLGGFRCDPTLMLTLMLLIMR